MFSKLKSLLIVPLLGNIAFAAEFQLTYGSEYEINPQWSPNDAVIAYVKDNPLTNYTYDIWIMTSDGSNQTNLTNTPTYNETFPSWSPDGTKIAFSSDRSGDWEIWTMTANGQNITRITNNNFIDGGPAWSPNGNTIAFYSIRNNNMDIYTININGTNEQRITTYTLEDKIPDYSPDGTRIAIESQRPFPPATDIWNISSTGGDEIWVSINIHNCMSPSFSPDGTQIAFNAQSPEDQLSYIWSVPASGGDAVQLTTGGGDCWPDWSHDGKKIVFSRAQSGNYNIWVKDLFTEQPFSWQRASCGWIKANFKY